MCILWKLDDPCCLSSFFLWCYSVSVGIPSVSTTLLYFICLISLPYHLFNFFQFKFIGFAFPCYRWRWGAAFYLFIENNFTDIHCKWLLLEFFQFIKIYFLLYCPCLFQFQTVSTFLFRILFLYFVYFFNCFRFFFYWSICDNLHLSKVPSLFLFLKFFFKFFFLYKILFSFLFSLCIVLCVCDGCIKSFYFF